MDQVLQSPAACGEDAGRNRSRTHRSGHTAAVEVQIPEFDSEVRSLCLTVELNLPSRPPRCFGTLYAPCW